MKLVDLKPQFLRLDPARPGTRHYVDTLTEADGVMFLCPACFVANGLGAVGTHRVVCWRPRVPESEPPTPGRWEMVGTSYADLTLSAASSSIQITSGCMAHFSVERGEIRMRG